MDIIPTFINQKRKNHTDQKSRGIRIIQYINNINSIKYLHSFSELSFHVRKPYFLFKMNKIVMKNYFPFSWNSFIYLYNINSRNLMKESSCKITKFMRKMHVFISKVWVIPTYRLLFCEHLKEISVTQRASSVFKFVVIFICTGYMYNVKIKF